MGSVLCACVNPVSSLRLWPLLFSSVQQTEYCIHTVQGPPPPPPHPHASHRAQPFMLQIMHPHASHRAPPFMLQIMRRAPPMRMATPHASHHAPPFMLQIMRRVPPRAHGDPPCFTSCTTFHASNHAQGAPPPPPMLHIVHNLSCFKSCAPMLHTVHHLSCFKSCAGRPPCAWRPPMLHTVHHLSCFKSCAGCPPVRMATPHASHRAPPFMLQIMRRVPPCFTSCTTFHASNNAQGAPPCFTSCTTFHASNHAQGAPHASHCALPFMLQIMRRAPPMLHIVHLSCFKSCAGHPPCAWQPPPPPPHASHRAPFML